jgi:hypothetical protein
MPLIEDEETSSIIETTVSKLNKTFKNWMIMHSKLNLAFRYLIRTLLKELVIELLRKDIMEVFTINFLT